MEKLKVVVIGGGQRASKTLKEIMKREDVSVLFGIYMLGFVDEEKYAHELSSLSKQADIPYEITDEITEGLTLKIKELQPELIYGIGVWRSHIEGEFLEIPKYGYIGLHGTALPEYRGMAGINWQIINGSSSIRMRLLKLNIDFDAGLLIGDANGNILEYAVELMNEKHLDEIFEDYDAQHIKATHDLFDLIISNSITFQPQNETHATYSCHRGPEDAEIDWSKSSNDIFNLIRSQSPPYGGAYTFYNQKKISIYRCRILHDYTRFKGRITGKVVEREKTKNTVAILTKDSAIEIIEARCGKETNVRKIFNSVRLKCISKEACVAEILSERFNLFN
jgi:methionyl-tRNA formyltransferase